ncbi:Choline transporter-like 1 [Carabus blaptoides fortunei]
MGCCGNDIEPTELEEIDRTSEDSVVFSGIKTKRFVTDRYGLIAMATFFVVLICLLGYCMYFGDLDRLLNGYDDCGNVCGKPNAKSLDFACHGEDMTNKRFLLIRPENDMSKECVANCDAAGAYIAYLNRCFIAKNTDDQVVVRKGINDFFSDVAEDLHMCWKQIVYLCLIALVFSIIMLILFRFVAGFVVWFVLIGLSLLLVAGTTYLWILFFSAKNQQDGIEKYDSPRISPEVFLGPAIFVTIVTVVVLLVILVLRKRIELVIQLFKEAGKAIADMPVMLLQPVLTFIVLVVTISSYIYFSLWIQSSGELATVIPETIDYNSGDHLGYRQTVVMMLTRWYNLFAVLWMIQFVVGCQHMIVAGCVATWFFARNKEHLGSPLISSTTNLLKYHLGTVAFGSFIIALVEFTKALLRTLKASLAKSRSFIACLLECCLKYYLEWLESFLKYFSRNAYIQTAIYGHPFCHAGKRALGLLVNNIFRVYAINSVGDFVLFFGKAFIVLATVLLGFEMLRDRNELHYVWFVLIVVGLFAYFIAHCFITIFEMAIDTIFLCFCEDCEQNDGLSRPYFMSRELMQFVKNSNKVMDKNWEANQHNYDDITARVYST